MTTSADEYNEAQLQSGKLKIGHISMLIEHWQRTHAGLIVDGKAGNMQTIPSIDAAIEAAKTPAHAPDPGLTIVEDWLTGAVVTKLPADSSWFSGALAKGKPEAIVAHFTDTDPGTAINMAKRRQHEFGADPDDRAASWHITIDCDGSVVVMIPMSHVAWHAGGPTSHGIAGLGPANNHSIGIELVGFGKVFTDAQVATARLVWRALVRQYGIPRNYAMVAHQTIDPENRDDPGPLWMNTHAPKVLDYAFAAPDSPDQDG